VRLLPRAGRRRRTQGKRRGAVLYHGPSRFNGRMILVILTGLGRRTLNVKTGDQVQVWVISAEVPPAEAVRSGLDEASCGDCSQRHGVGGHCYVIEAQAPQQVWRAWARGAYEDWTERMPDGALAGVSARLAAYGELGAAPDRVLRRIFAQDLAGWTGYTHQWDVVELQWLRGYLMASVDSHEERELAQSMGWRTFRASGERDPDGTEIQCANVTVGVQCVDCGICAGQKAGGDRSVWIPVHGSRVAKRAALTASGE